MIVLNLVGSAFLTFVKFNLGFVLSKYMFFPCNKQTGELKKLSSCCKIIKDDVFCVFVNMCYGSCSGYCKLNNLVANGRNWQ